MAHGIATMVLDDWQNDDSNGLTVFSSSDIQNQLYARPVKSYFDALDNVIANSDKNNLTRLKTIFILWAMKITSKKGADIIIDPADELWPKILSIPVKELASFNAKGRGITVTAAQAMSKKIHDTTVKADSTNPKEPGTELSVVGAEPHTDTDTSVDEKAKDAETSAEDAKKAAEEAAKAEEAKKAEEAAKAEEAKKAKEAAKAAEDAKKAKEAAKAAEEAKKAKEAAKAAEDAKKAEEAAKAAEEAKKAEEAAKAAEEAKKAEEAAKAAEEAKKAEEAAKATEEAKKAEEAAKATEEAKKADKEEKKEEAASSEDDEEDAEWETMEEFMSDDDKDDSAGAEGAGAEAAGAESAGAEAAGAEAAGAEAAGAESAGAESTGAEGAGAEGTGAESAGAEDAGAEGAGAEGTGAESAGAEDAGADGTDDVAASEEIAPSATAATAAVSPTSSDEEEPIPAESDEPAPSEDIADIPENTDPRDEYSDVYDEIDRLAISPEQAEEAKNYADTVFNSPDEFERAYAVLTRGPSKARTRCIAGMLATANNHLGYKNTDPKYNPDRVPFDNGTATQAKHNGRVTRSLIMPSGFGTKKNAAIWNTPVITDFGFPFINFSSDAMLGILKAKTDDDIKNDNLKKMFKEASKRYGGIWKAIYASPLTLIKQIAVDTGVKCTAKYLKVNGQDLISSESGESVAVIPIKYYSVDPAYDGAITIPHDFLTAFYDVIDYSTTSKRMYLKYAEGMTEQDFVEELNENNGVPPFYLLVPKTARFSKCQIRSGSLLGSLLNVILGRQKCTMVKTMIQGKRGALAMESRIADLLYAET
jgi:hypothetical protein